MDTVKKINPQIVRSKKWIVEALITLMKEKEFKDITITEICSTADVVRRTFYRYYKTKEDVITEHMTLLYEQYLDQFCSTQAKGVSITYNYFNFWMEHMELLQLLERNKLLPFIMLNYKKFIPKINDRFYTNLLDNYSETDVEYYYLFIAGGLWKVMLKWIEKGAKETPTEMADKVRSMLSFKIMARLKEEDTSKDNRNNN